MTDRPASWRDHEDRPVEVPPPPGPDDAPFYEPIGDFQGAHYRRNAFARGTQPEVDALARRLDLRAGERVLDVGCGDGRHLRALAARGIGGVGIDVSRSLLDAARAQAAAAGLAGLDFVRADARRLDAVAEVSPGSFDVAWSLSHGGLGTDPASDAAIVRALAAAVRPGGRVAYTVFHALFAVRHLVPGDAFDPVHAIHHQRSEVRGADGERRRFDLWSVAYTAREAIRLATDAGLDVVNVVGAEPGRYDSHHLRLDDPELLVIARRP